MSDQLRPDTSSPGEDFNHNAADVSGIPRTRPAGPPADPPKLTPESERLRDEIEKRLGAFPPYFVPALHRPSVLESYWNQTLICYLDNPLPALFKEKLLARLARFCSVAYAVVSHTTNLREMGMTAGEVLDLLELPIPSSETDIEHQLRILEAESAPLVSWPEHNSSVEKSLIPCMLFFFANPGRSGRCQQAISRLLSAEQYTNLTALFAYIKSYHLWVETYPGPPIETVPQVWDRFVSMLREEPRLAKVFRNYREKTVERRGQTGFEALQQSHAELESKLKKNTSDLAKAVEILKDEIARRKRVEKELSDRQEQYKELFENTYDLVFTYNVSGKITSLNNAAERLSGYPRDEALRLNIAQLMAPDSMEVVQEMLYSDVSSGVPARYELAMVTKGNQRVEVELNQRRITSPGGTAEFQAIVRPIGDGNREVKDVRDTDGIAEGSVSRAIAESEPLLLQKTAELLKANELLQARNGEREHTMEALRRMLAESEIRSAELERANKSLQEKIAKLEQADKTTEDTRQRSQQEIGQPSEATRALHAQVEERERDIEALRKVLAESETRSAVLLKATETFRAQMEEREHTEQNLRQALSESEARHAALLKTIEALQTRIDDYERTAEALRRASTNTETHLRQQVDELAELRDALQAGGGEHERTVQALRAALAESEARRSEIAQAHEACQAKIV
ncbi:MAG TPA: PAS domain S-box protein, partial [Acidobacteriota bacterium]|nr:PAS domain S-box protein [Acidobacteriota bacterium]